eukprot:CAMPEP_0119002678 /NCGR_PEP_ID=MMETSP1176-20130426/18_1 /TAXON_ID=265551 /ORGANISM="Synedropsis recta cf, Strain CCMP1620" /LENGTH=413 /DNA_ID=CAMNT_0006954185 /DNA_START=51 /DNA_END=1292 /DNA_ORIENTATION=+
MNFQGATHSKLVQRKIRKGRHADREFARIANDSSEIPIVLVPRAPFPFYIGVNVPSGPFVLYQRWYEDKGELAPGVICFWPFWYRISHIVTRSVISYNAPAQNCPTADNIMVNVDLSLTFQIGPDAEAASNFVYRLGAHRFDELLSAETEEAIRALVYSVTHDQVNDLREEFAQGMLSTVNSKVSHYGVKILNVKITDVKLPAELQKRLETTTGYKTKLGEQEKIHENKVRVLEDEATKELETIRKKNARNIQILQAEHLRFKIQHNEMEERALGQATVQDIEAMALAGISKMQAEGDEKVEVIAARQNVEALLKKAEIESQKIKIESKQIANAMVVESQAQLDVAESKAASMIVKAEAEFEGAEALTEKRQYELEWTRLAVLKTIAGKGRRFISGPKGEALLNDLVPATARV